MTQNLHVYGICCRPEVDNDVMSGVAVNNVGMDVPMKFNDSRSDGFRDIRGAYLVSNERTIERTNIKWLIPIARNAMAFRLNMSSNRAFHTAPQIAVFAQFYWRYVSNSGGNSASVAPKRFRPPTHPDSDTMTAPLLYKLDRIRPINRSINQSINQSVSQSVSQSIN